MAKNVFTSAENELTTSLEPKCVHRTYRVFVQLVSRERLGLLLWGPLRLRRKKGLE